MEDGGNANIKKPVLTYPGLMLARKVDTSSDSAMFACFGTFVDSDAGRKGEAEIGPGRFLALCSGMAEKEKMQSFRRKGRS